MFLGNGGRIYDIVKQADGKIICVGQEGDWDGEHNIFVMRVTQTGKVDTTFGDYGFLIYDTELFSQLSSVTFDTDSNILVSGHVYTSPANADFFTARITPNGQFDTTFGLNGIIITPLTEYHDIAYDLAIQSDGKIIVAGTA